MKGFLKKNTKENIEEVAGKNGSGVDHLKLPNNQTKGLNERQKKETEISLIMRLPEVKNELIKKANPMNFDLYKCAFRD